MPLEIRELVIKAEIKAGKEEDTQESGEGLNIESLIRECVERVVEKLKENNER